ncbi:hypothetical protein V6Z11_D09G279900 [Gossypium hirsutum]|uniref:Uncharacterized protein isoform X1 n=1 Tax=Gossypium hirsutum TaxID=3635 RepID=A0ABM3AMX6_GOSHI|nr:uncharacterized protein LOC107931483 isoform X1 [Gossypium hirsutum]
MELCSFSPCIEQVQLHVKLLDLTLQQDIEIPFFIGLKFQGFSAECFEWPFQPWPNRNKENSSQNLLHTFSANAFKVASFITALHFQVWRYGATDENLLRNIGYSALEQTS